MTFTIGKKYDIMGKIGTRYEVALAVAKRARQISNKRIEISSLKNKLSLLEDENINKVEAIGIDFSKKYWYDIYILKK